MSHPFEDPDADYVTLVNSEGQYSLWPLVIQVPIGWTIVHQGKRQACLAYINEHWVDMRPNSLIKAMNG